MPIQDTRWLIALTPLRGDSTSTIVSWGHAMHATVHSVASDGSAQVQVEFSLEGRVDLFSYAVSYI